jgi:hypothetical protein
MTGMFEVVVSERFAAWYDNLPEALAEEVTLALDVAAGLGKAIDPARSRQLLLWFDGTAGQSFAELDGQLERHAMLLGWGYRMAHCLESATFRERLAELEPERAREVLLAVERVQRLLAGIRIMNVLGAVGASASVRLSVSERWLHELLVSERERAVLLSKAAGVEPPGELAPPSEAPAPLYVAVLEALRLAGLSPNTFFDDEQTGLRELSVGAGPWRGRLLCGVDVPGQRIVAILGERLDRAYYGDSVKFAEAYFREYLARRGLARATVEEP